MKRKAYPVYKPSGIEWLGDIPKHWEEKRLRFMLNLNPSKQEIKTWSPETDVSFISMESVGEDGSLKLEISRPIEEVISGYTYFSEGDVTFAKITPCFENGKGAIMYGLKNSIGFGTTELTVIRSGKSLYNKYLYNITISNAFRQIGTSWMYGAGGQKRVPDEFVSEFRIGFPPLSEQEAIAVFLDRETGRIDLLVEKKKRLVELLREKRSALISRVVTKGLDMSVKMKPSGIDWLGDIPEHWELIPFKKYVTKQIDYRGATPEKVDEGIFLVTAKNIKMGFIDYDCSKEFVEESEYKSIMRRGFPQKGDILFTTEAPLGNVAMVNREDIALAQRVILFRMNFEFLHYYSLYLMLSSFFQNQLGSLATGSTAEGIKASKLTILLFIKPPLSEQKAIADYLDKETARIDALIQKVEIAIDKLNEFRSTLISAAVTGKIDVRDVG